MKYRRIVGAVTLVVLLIVLGTELSMRWLHEDGPIDRNTMGAPDYKDVGQGGKRFWPGGLLTPTRSLEVFNGYGGTVPWRTNAAGFRSAREFDQVPPPGVLRILSLGDCFSVGYRVAQGKAFPDLIGERTGSEIGPCEVLIGHTRCPALTVSYMKEHGRLWKPDVLLLNVSVVNDVVESYLTLDLNGIGFMDLIEEANSLPACCRTRPADEGVPPWSWDWFREHSKILGALTPSGACTKTWYDTVGDPYLLDPNQGLGLFMIERVKIVEDAWSRFFWSLSEIADRCHEWKIALVVVIIPLRFQVSPKDWDATATCYGLKKGAFDLRLPNKRIGDFCRNKRVNVIDACDRLSRLMKADMEKFYLPDGEAHWNEEGHRAFTSIVWEDLTGALGQVKKR
jgi:hypothetical protein